MCSILSILFMVIPSSTTSSGYNRSIQGIFFLPQPIHFLMEFRLERFVTVCLYQGTLCPPHSGPAAGPSHVHKRDHHCTHEDTGMDCHEGTMNEGIYGISLPHTCTKGGYPPYQKGNLSWYHFMIRLLLLSSALVQLNALFLSIFVPNLLTSNSIFITKDIIIDEGDWLIVWIKNRSFDDIDRWFLYFPFPFAWGISGVYCKTHSTPPWIGITHFIVYLYFDCVVNKTQFSYILFAHVSNGASLQIN